MSMGNRLQELTSSEIAAAEEDFLSEYRRQEMLGYFDQQDMEDAMALANNNLSHHDDGRDVEVEYDPAFLRNCESTTPAFTFTDTMPF